MAKEALAVLGLPKKMTGILLGQDGGLQRMIISRSILMVGLTLRLKREVLGVL
jgi:hypothetical protein